MESAISSNLFEQYKPVSPAFGLFGTKADCKSSSETSKVSSFPELSSEILFSLMSKPTTGYFVENNQPTKDGYCNHCNIGTYDLDYDTEIRLDVDYDFCCNKYEEKGVK